MAAWLFTEICKHFWLPEQWQEFIQMIFATKRKK